MPHLQHYIKQCCAKKIHFSVGELGTKKLKMGKGGTLDTYLGAGVALRVWIKKA